MSATRDFLGTVIASGLELDMLSPDDLIAVVTMDVLAHHLPVELKARLITAALKATEMTPTLVLDTLGVEGIVEHAPAPLLWKVVATAATRALGKEGPALSPVANEAPVARKPNLSARASRVRAGATSRPPVLASVAPVADDDESAFDVDTRVGTEQPIGDFDVLEEASAFPGDDVTAHGKD